ncbi:MAG TPA: hypothetical protein VHR47_03640, partial [Bacillota bacterium]|nr:hypothetical protein [Bacillota bacterium]
MKALETKLHHLGLGIPSILLPSAGTDLTKWAVVACDQYTSQPEYWKKIEDRPLCCANQSLGTW